MSGRGRRRKQPDDGWTERGGYMPAKMQKLAAQNSVTQLDSDIFKGVAIYVNGYTNPTSEELKKMVIKNGGVYQHFYSKTRVTHIIASNLPTSKIAQLKNEKVVSPEWIVNSVKEGKLLPYQDYMLYTPAHVQQSTIATSFKNLSTTFPNSNQHKTTTSTSSTVLEETNYSGLWQDSVNEDISQDTSTNDVTSTLFDQPEKSQDLTLAPAPSSDLGSMKAGHPEFVSSFYGRSRLHHISQWGAESKAYVTKLQKLAAERAEKGDPIRFPGKERLSKVLRDNAKEGSDLITTLKDLKNQKVYAHIDFDCFFVSVGLLKRPDLVDDIAITLEYLGKPVAVTNTKGKGPSSGSRSNAEDAQKKSESFISFADIACCSYEARQTGVRNGMYFGEAQKICPGIVAVPYDFEAYKTVSQKFYDIILSYTLDVEAVSCDELFVDCTELLRETGATPLQFADAVRKEVFQATGCTCSSGLGSNMLLARLATKVAKPNGQHWVEPGGEAEFMKDKKVSDLPGVGYIMSKKLSSLKVKYCEDLCKLSEAELQKSFGAKVGSRLYKHARGQDDRCLKVDVDRKSVSAEINYGIRFTQNVEAEDFVKELSREVQSRLQQLKKKGRHVTLKVKVRQEGAPKESHKFMGHGLCDNVSRSSLLPVASDSAEIIGQECCGLLSAMRLPVEDLRGFGIQISSLESLLPNVLPNNKSALSFPTSSHSILKYTTTQAASKQKDSSSSTAQLSDVQISGLDTSSDIQLSEVQTNKVEVPNSVAKRNIFDFYSVKKVPEGSKGKKKNEPALPSLNLETSETDRNTNDVEDSYLSQIDMATLNELPEDIRNEILNALKRKPEPLPPPEPGKDTAGAASRLPEPGCSHWRNDGRNGGSDDDDGVSDAGIGRESNNGEVQTEQNRPDEETGLDESFLLAMPEDIRQELIAAHRQEKLLKQQQQLQKQQTPTKKSPPRMLGLVSPAKNVLLNKPKRGRKRKSEKTAAVETSKGVKNGINKQSRKKKSAVGPKFVSKVTNQVRLEKQNAEQVAAVEVPLLMNDGNEEAVGEDEEPINFLGCVETNDVKELVRNWISTSDPDASHIGTFVDYLLRLVQSSDIEKVFVILRFLQRLENVNLQWKEELKNVISTSQAAVKSLYGGKLKLIKETAL